MNILCLFGIHKPSAFVRMVYCYEKLYKKHGGGYRYKRVYDHFPVCDRCGKVIGKEVKKGKVKGKRKWSP